LKPGLLRALKNNSLDLIQQKSSEAGTKFLARTAKFASRHAWIAFGRTAKGSLIIDDGAKKALVDQRKSLLPKGIKSIRGSFSLGDTVQIKTANGSEIGRGLVNYNSDDLKVILGHHTKEIPALLGRAAAAEVVHRDNLVIL